MTPDPCSCTCDPVTVSQPILANDEVLTAIAIGYVFLAALLYPVLCRANRRQRSAGLTLRGKPLPGAPRTAFRLVLSPTERRIATQLAALFTPRNLAITRLSEARVPVVLEWKRG